MPRDESGYLQTIKAKFIEEFDSGLRPSIVDYVRQYPQYAEELMDFMTAYIQWSAQEEREPKNEPEVTDDEVDQLARRWMQTLQSPPTFAQRISQLGLTGTEFERLLRLPRTLLADAFRLGVRLPAEAWSQLEVILNLNPPEIAGLFGPAAAKAFAEPNGAPGRETFADLLERHSRSIADDDLKYWQSLADRP
jgi:hypothetical protein